MYHTQNNIDIDSRRPSVPLCSARICVCCILFATTSNSKCSSNRHRKDAKHVGRDELVSCVVQQHCAGVDKATWVIIQALLDACEAQSLDTSTKAETRRQFDSESVLSLFF